MESSLRAEPPEGIRFILYRIGQEAMTNIRKHASPKHVTVALGAHNGGYLLTVGDDGLGFNAEETAARGLPGHMGLRTMRRRAEGAGGWLLVESTPGAGTIVQAWIPARLGDIPGNEP